MFLLIMMGKYDIPNSISPECRDLIKIILVVDPQERATLEQMRNHPWTTASDTLPKLHMCTDMSCCMDTALDDPEIVAKVESLACFSKKDILEALKLGFPSSIIAAYHIIKKNCGVDRRRMEKHGLQDWIGETSIISDMEKLSVQKLEQQLEEVTLGEEKKDAIVRRPSQQISEDDTEEGDAKTPYVSRGTPSSRRATLMSAKDRIEKIRASSNKR
jgi:hypothetical protein